MALDIVTGYTDDGTVFLKMEGQQNERGKPIRTIVTLEPDMARDVAKKMLEASDKAMIVNKRPLIVGQEQTFKKE